MEAGPVWIAGKIAVSPAEGGQDIRQFGALGVQAQAAVPPADGLLRDAGRGSAVPDLDQVMGAVQAEAPAAVGTKRVMEDHYGAVFSGLIQFRCNLRAKGFGAGAKRIIARMEGAQHSGVPAVMGPFHTGKNAGSGFRKRDAGKGRVVMVCEKEKIQAPFLRFYGKLPGGESAV